MPYIPSIQQVRAKPDPAPAWRWVVKMPDLTPRTQIAGFPKDYAGLSRVSSTPFGMVDRIDFSVRQIDSDQRFGGGTRMNYPRFVSIADVSISFYEDVNYVTTQYLRSWMNLVVDEDFNYGVPAIYKHDIKLFAFDYISNTRPVMVGTLVGCWPTNFSGLSYQYDQSGPVTITSTFAVDRDIIEVGGGSSNPLGRLGGPFAALGQISNTFRSAADGVRGTVNEIMAPVREVTGFVREATNTVRDGLDAVRDIRNSLMEPIREIRTAADDVQRTVREARGVYQQAANTPRDMRNEFRGITSGFRGMFG